VEGEEMDVPSFQIPKYATAENTQIHNRKLTKR